MSNFKPSLRSPVEYWLFVSLDVPDKIKKWTLRGQIRGLPTADGRWRDKQERIGLYIFLSKWDPWTSSAFSSRSQCHGTFILLWLSHSFRIPPKSILYAFHQVSVKRYTIKMYRRVDIYLILLFQVLCSKRWNSKENKGRISSITVNATAVAHSRKFWINLLRGFFLNQFLKPTPGTIM